MSLVILVFLINSFNVDGKNGTNLLKNKSQISYYNLRSLMSLLCLSCKLSYPLIYLKLISGMQSTKTKDVQKCDCKNILGLSNKKKCVKILQ